MTYVHFIIALIYFILVVGTIISVLMENRQPEKTVAWICVLMFVPVFGMLIYFFFGRDTRRERLIGKHSMDQLSRRQMLGFVEQKDFVVPQKHKALVNLFYNQNEALPFINNEVELYTNGYDFILSLLHDIAGAKNHIHICSYIFEDDSLGRLVSDALIDKAREGVEVRVIYDDVGCWKVKDSFFERMRFEGIEVHSFMPVKFPAFTGKVNYRNHRKLIVIDGYAGYIGGMNIAKRYVQGTGSREWRDTHMRITGSAVYGIQRTFLIDWFFVDGSLITNNKYYPQIPGNINNGCMIQIVVSSPIAPWPDIMQGYVRILMSAEKYVYIETPYFLPTEPILFAMRTAALAGVDVILMIPNHADSKLVEWAANSYVRQTLDAGVKVMLYKKGFNHSKLLISDDALCTCGSTNVDFRSFENNFESNAFIYDTDMALRMKDVFLEDLKYCVPLSEHKIISQYGFFRRLGESVVRLLSPLF